MRRARCSSITPPFRRHRAAAWPRQREAAGIACVDAPVTGGQAGAENGKLAIMCGGSDAGDRRAPPGDGGLCRADRPCRRGRRRADRQDGQPDLHRRRARRPVAKRVRFAQAPGSTWTRCSKRFPAARRKAGRWTIAGRRWPRTSSTSASRSTGCARISAIALDEAQALGSRSPVTALVDQFYAEVQAEGRRRGRIPAR